MHDNTDAQLDYQKIFEAGLGCFLLLAPDSPRFTILAASGAYLAATKTRRTEIVGKSVFEVFPDNPADLTTAAVEYARGSFQRVLDLRRVDVMGIRRHDIRDPLSGNGSFETRYWKAVNAPIPGVNGEVAYILHQAEDVTDFEQSKLQSAEMKAANISLQDAWETTFALMEKSVETRKLAEQAAAALREIQERLSLTLSAADAGGWDWDIETGQLNWTKELYTLFGIDPGQKTASFETWKEVVHPDDYDVAGGKIAAAVKEQSSLQNEYRIVLPTGEIRWISSIGRCLYDPAGRPLRMAGICTDITERKKMEEVQLFLASTSLANPDEPFFNSLARYLARSLDMFFVCIDILEGGGLNARTLAVWSDDHFEDDVTYALKDTPCGDVVGKEVCCYPVSVCQFFPRDQVLQDLKAESYIGVTLFSHTGRPIGLIAVIGRTALPNRPLAEKIMKLVAVRAAGELERLIAEEKLMESERSQSDLLEKLNQAQQVALIGSWEWSLKENRVWWSEETYRIFGVTPQEYVPSFEGNGEFIHPDDRAAYGRAFEHSLQTGEPLELDIRLIIRNGAQKYCTAKGRPVYDAAREPVRFIGTIMDTTERKRTEDILRRSDRFKVTVLESINDAFFSLDNSMVVTYFNHAAEKALGKRQDEVIGRGLFDVFVEARGSIFEENYTRSLREKTALSFETWFGVAPYENWYEVRTYPFDEGLAVSFQLITERKQKEKIIEEKNAELERFTYTVSHDLKSPLVTIKTFLGYLEQDLAGNNREQAAKDIDYIRTASSKMVLMLNELLEISRIGRVESSPARVTFHELADEALNTMAGNIAEKHVAVRVHESGIVLHGDRPRLAEILQNLVENAIKYTGEQQEPRVELGAEGEGQETVFFVRDNGIGIDPRFKDKIFGLFDKLDPKSEGSGLGLALVKRIVELYQGRIWVESDGAGKGSCFKFTLPGAVKEHE